MTNRRYTYYGYKLVFDENSNADLKCININEISSIPLTDFSHKVNFHTNQNREISLYTKSPLETFTMPNEWLFCVEGVVSFLCKGDTQKLYYKKELHYSDTLMRYWLIHIVLPIALTLDASYYFLHTGSVNINNKAVLFTGESYAGKSTLTDYFLKKGHALVSDDKLATFQKDERVYSQPSHPFHRPYRAMEDLGIESENFHTHELEIGALYWLEPAKATDDVEIKELKGLKKFECLRYATEMDLGVNQKKRFTYLTQLANSVKLYAIKVPRDLQRLEEVYAAITTHNR